MAAMPSYDRANILFNQAEDWEPINSAQTRRLASMESIPQRGWLGHTCHGIDLRHQPNRQKISGLHRLIKKMKRFRRQRSASGCWAEYEALIASRWRAVVAPPSIALQVASRPGYAQLLFPAQTMKKWGTSMLWDTKSTAMWHKQHLEGCFV